jgi:hypothetical protein
LGPFESYNGGDDIVDTLKFSLDAHENYGIYIQPIATDFIDTSSGGDIFGYYLDNHNDPPNEYNLISPANNSYTLQQIPFSWKNNGDPDPYNRENRNISKVEVWFDSVANFDSPGLQIYVKSRTGSIFEKDTILVELPSNFFGDNGLYNYKKIYWKAVMYDFDRDQAEGGGKGVLSRESLETFVLNIGAIPNKPESPTLNYPENNSVILSDSVIFSWEKTFTATDYYWFEISKDSVFSKSKIDTTLINNNKVVSDIQENQNYWWRVKAKNISGWSDFSEVYKFSTIITDFKNEDVIPEHFSLEQNYPNPFNPSTTINFSLPVSSNVNLAIYDLLGEKIIEVVNSELAPGVYRKNINMNLYSSGVYFYRLKTNNFTDIKKMIFMK